MFSLYGLLQLLYIELLIISYLPINVHVTGVIDGLCAYYGSSFFIIPNKHQKSK